MRFVLFSPCAGNSDTCGYTFLAEGVIQTDSAAVFERTLREHRTRDGSLPAQPRVAFDSPGGSILGALKLGELLRKLKAHVVLAPAYDRVDVSRSLEEVPFRRSVVCASACVFAFAGGVMRQVAPKARLGVHQFTGSRWNIGEAASQVTAAVLADYLDRMGVDRRLLDVAFLTPPQEMHYLSLSEIESHGLDNTTVRTSPWALDADRSGALYARLLRVHPATKVTVQLLLNRTGEGAVLTVAVAPGDGRLSAASLARDFAGLELAVRVDGQTLARLSSTQWAEGGGSAFTRVLLPSQFLPALARGKILTIDTWPGRAFAHLSPGGDYPLAGMDRFAAALMR
jgi:hypothetical protein